MIKHSDWQSTPYDKWQEEEGRDLNKGEADQVSRLAKKQWKEINERQRKTQAFSESAWKILCKFNRNHENVETAGDEVGSILYTSAGGHSLGEISWTFLQKLN